jgi:hypothetical protein
MSLQYLYGADDRDSRAFRCGLILWPQKVAQASQIVQRSWGKLDAHQV